MRSCIAVLTLLAGSAALADGMAPAPAGPASTVPGAAEPEGTSGSATTLPLMAVPRMRASNEQTDGELAHMLSEILTVEARKVQGVQVLSMSDIEATLGFEQQKQLLGCDDTSCMAELGGAMGCRLILSSRVGRVGDTYVLALSVIDTQSVKVVSSTYDTVEGKPDALIARIRGAVPGLLEPVIRPAAATSTRAATPPASRTGSGDELIVHWPAIGVAAVGALTLIGAGVVGTIMAVSWSSIPSDPDDTEAIGGVTMHAVGRQASVVATQTLAGAFVSTALVGLAATAGGVAWQVMAQGGEP
jgi:hypothetical protein